ncbi:MAG: SH3 domain-containing protein [Chloroflexi bacterium]|nr:SH3 domain-containing protein [Chloroflexota bacterium]
MKRVLFTIPLSQTLRLLSAMSLSLLLSIPAALPALAQTIAISGTVYQTTNLRTGPGTRFEIVGQLAEEDEVSVLGRDAQGGWLYVRTAQALNGWLPAFALELSTAVDIMDLALVDPDTVSTPTPGSSVFIETYGRVNVRSGPGVAYGVVARLDVGDRAEATARSSAGNDWLLIVLDEETSGWIAFFTVNVFGDATELPILIPDAASETLVTPQSLARALFNVRLHEEPSLDSPLVVIIPFGRRVTPLARTEDGAWLLIGFDETEGWGAAELFLLDSEILDALPISES